MGSSMFSVAKNRNIARFSANFLKGAFPLEKLPARFWLLSFSGPAVFTTMERIFAVPIS